MTMNGVILVSAVLDLKTIIFDQGDDISYILYLPSYASTAWYHNKIANKPASIESFLAEAKNFATSEFAGALMKGDNLSESESKLLP